MNLRELLEEAGSALPGVDIDVAPDRRITWARAGRPFATLEDDDTAEFALEAAVAAAAIRTPDAAASTRGAGWVRFHPPVVDQHAADRAAAWFGSAYRRQDRS